MVGAISGLQAFDALGPFKEREELMGIAKRRNRKETSATCVPTSLRCLLSSNRNSLVPAEEAPDFLANLDEIE